MLAFAFNFLAETNPSSPIFDEKYAVRNATDQLRTGLSNFEDVANDVNVRLSKAQPSPLDYVFLIFLGAFQIPIVFLGFVFTSIKMILALLVGTIFGSIGEVAGSSTIMGLISLVSGVIFSILLVTIVLLIIKAIRTGESER